MILGRYKISAIHNLNSQGNLVSDGSAILVMKSRIPKLRVRLGSAFCASQTFAFLPFFFFFIAEKFDFSTHFQPHVGLMHCSRTHKFHFSASFSLKMGLTVLFTHLKIILLQCFSVFNF